MKSVSSPGARVVRPTVGGVATTISSNVAQNRQARHLPPRLQVVDEVPAHPSMTEPLENFLGGPVSDALPQISEEELHAPWQTALRNAHPLVLSSPIPWAGSATLLALTEHTVFPVQVNEPPTPPGRHKHQDFYANVGDAIRTLREDIPLLFAKDLDYSIYREDIVFRDPNLQFKGMKNYEIIFWSLRFHGRLFFKLIYVDVLRIWQAEDHQIKMRWRVHAVPRVWWQAEGTIDGVSTYKLDNDGKIYEHMVDNVQLRDPPITNPLLYGLNYVLAPRMRPQQVPFPGSYGFAQESSAVGPDGLQALSSADH